MRLAAMSAGTATREEKEGEAELMWGGVALLRAADSPHGAAHHQSGVRLRIGVLSASSPRVSAVRTPYLYKELRVACAPWRSLAVGFTPVKVTKHQLEGT